jgi:Kef-type K+ transport system membrane component KefB
VEVIERLIELLVILAGAKIGAEIMTRIRQPAVIGELLVGMVIGASVLGWIAIDEGGLISIMAEIGVMVIGIPLIRHYFRFLGWLRVEGSYVVGAFAFAVAVGIAAEEIAGLDPIVGAFAAGLVAAQSGHHERVFRELRPIVHLWSRSSSSRSGLGSMSACSPTHRCRSQAA